MTDTWPLTDEQARAVELFGTGKDLKIEAGAGAGKTATLVALARDQGARRGAYLAFNRALVNEAQLRVPPNIEANTVHSFAHTAVVKQRPALRARLSNSERLKRQVEAGILGIRGAEVIQGTPVGRKVLGKAYLVGYVMEGIRRFCQSDDPLPAAKHLPTIDVLDPWSPKGGHRGPNNWALAERFVRYMDVAWADLTSDHGRLRFDHPHYLKMWELDNPRIPAEFLLLDEAQDLSAVMRSVIFNQRDAFGTQLCFVGDPAQAIYGFTGATDAMSYLEGNHATLSKSFRFGPEVARVANLVLAHLDESELRIVGHDPVRSTIEAVDVPDCILTRTNAKAVKRALELMAEGYSVGLAKSLKDNVIGFARAAHDLQTQGWTSHRELAPFSTWEEVERFVEDDPAGSELALLASLVNEFGVDVIISELARTTSADRADIELSTAHTSKGRQWSSVQIADDFPQPEPGETIPDLAPEELRLLYVAVTRAQHRLDITQVPWIELLPAGGGS